ncbi:hypothetical protein D9758_014096 [Tetrapyrgos nigripes]|uniref:Uncharacterized protein n=1 Tax=Tetrapyrgos nigripes TaxID=182062 RepID=A0A8H5CC98_9AGAR|nr:hypothetical protein D9758_014096 [Tetrapyrgos nigripes]
MSDVCTCNSNDSTGNFGTTVTGGIQDISALLPLLGTEQCEEHISSGLTRGYFYVAATPLSIFGSLGLARAAFKALVASIYIPSWNFHGAEKLADAGFWGVGDNLPLILLDKKVSRDKDEAAEKSEAKSEVLVWGALLEHRKRQKHGDNMPSPRYLAASRLDSLLNDLHVHKNSSITVETRCTEWNLVMIAVTAVSGFFSIVPYIYLNHGTNSNKLPFVTRWAFPITRALGGFLCATMTPLIIEVRLRIIVEEQLRKRARKESELLVRADGQLYRFLPIFQILLLIGVLGSVAGYIGCFTVVQNASKPLATISWLLLEAGLSIIRIVLWGVNPGYDDAPPFSLSIKLNDDPLLPTCNKYGFELEEEGTLPMVRADKFLPEVTSYVGQVEDFNDPRYTLYYTLTCESESDKRPLLYITVIDSTERTGWIYTRASPSSPSSNSSSAPLSSDTPSPTFHARSIDVDEHDVPQAKIDALQRGIHHTLGDEIEEKIKSHYRSIVDQLMLRLGDKYIPHWEGPLTSRYGMAIPHCIPLRQGYETLFTKWTLMMRDTRSQRLQYKDRKRVIAVAEGSLEDGGWHDGLSYLRFSSKWRKIEKKVPELYHDIDDEIVKCDTWLRSRLTSLEWRENDVNSALKFYCGDMENGLLEEVHRWECILWYCHQQMTEEKLDGDRLKTQAIYNWKTNSRNRLNDQVRCMEERKEKLEHRDASRLRDDWDRFKKSMASEEGPDPDFKISEPFGHYLDRLQYKIKSIIINLRQHLLQRRTSVDLRSETPFGCRMVDLLELSLTKSRVAISDEVILDVGVDGVLKAINENPFKNTILQVDFTKTGRRVDLIFLQWYIKSSAFSSDALVKLVAGVSNMPRLTSIHFPSVTEITKDVAIILRNIELGRGHSIQLYVGSHWDQWKEAPVEETSPSISLWNFTASGNFDEMTVATATTTALITLNFQAPAKGNVILKIIHNSTGSRSGRMTITRNKKSLIEVPVERRANFYSQTIELRPQQHFDSGDYNTVGLIVGYFGSYVLLGLELAAEDDTLLLSMPWRRKKSSEEDE